MTIQRKELLAILRKIKPGIDDNSTNIQGMDCFIFMDGRVHAHDDAVSISAPFDFPGHIAVSAIEFYEILFKFSKDDVEVVIGENELQLKCGRAKATVLYRKEDLTKRIKEIMPKEDNWLKLPLNFYQKLKLLTLKNVSPDIQAKIGGVFVKEDVMVASDNSSIIRFKHTTSLYRMWLSPRAVTLVAKEDVKQYCSTGAWLHFRNDSIQLSCRRLIDEKYPYESYRAILSGIKPTGIKGTFTKKIVDILDRAAVFAKDKDGDYVVNLTFAEGMCTITSGSGSGSFEESLEMKVEASQEVKIVLSALRLKQALGKWEEIEFYLGQTVEDNPLLILHSGDYMEVICLVKE
jgi:hypothetical protein